MFKKNESYDKLYNYINNFLNEMKSKEMYILKNVFLELNTTESIDSDININDIDTKHISEIYYKEIDAEIPQELGADKVNEILIKLFDQTKIYFEKLNFLVNKKNIKFNDCNKEGFNKNSDEVINVGFEKLFLISEILAYDYIYHVYGFTQDQIRMGIIINDIDYKVVMKGDNNNSNINN